MLHFAFRLWAVAVLTFTLVPESVLARNFTLREDLSGTDFFSAFRWWSYQDPTRGAVDYVDQRTAQRDGLSYVDGRGNFVIRADNTSVLSGTQERRSVRIHSKNLMGDGILVARFHYIPQGCGTWPAFWTCTTDYWPAGGEIDIIEGANDQGPRNLASLHTLYGCHIPAGRTSQHTGNTNEADCSYQPGCSVQFSQANSFGPDFNQNGGGWFAMRRDTVAGGEGIGVWFWPASSDTNSLPRAVTAPADGSAPPFVFTGSNATGYDRSELNKWGQPAAFFPNIANSSVNTPDPNQPVCDMQRFFEPHEIIINLTLCGYWAGETFSSSGCAARNGNVSCEEFVRQNPSAFDNARWEIEYLRTYTDGGHRASSTGALLLTAVPLVSLAMLLF